MDALDLGVSRAGALTPQERARSHPRSSSAAVAIGSARPRPRGCGRSHVASRSGDRTNVLPPVQNSLRRTWHAAPSMQPAKCARHACVHVARPSLPLRSLLARACARQNLVCWVSLAPRAALGRPLRRWTGHYISNALRARACAGASLSNVAPCQGTGSPDIASGLCCNARQLDRSRRSWPLDLAGSAHCSIVLAQCAPQFQLVAHVTDCNSSPTSPFQSCPLWRHKHSAPACTAQTASAWPVCGRHRQESTAKRPACRSNGVLECAARTAGAPDDHPRRPAQPAGLARRRDRCRCALLRGQCLLARWLCSSGWWVQLRLRAQRRCIREFGPVRPRVYVGDGDCRSAGKKRCKPFGGSCNKASSCCGDFVCSKHTCRAFRPLLILSVALATLASTACLRRKPGTRTTRVRSRSGGGGAEGAVQMLSMA